ncbi:MAG TPA: hypothetical protein PLX89_13805 [Verrucomicrobiota bacterium]|nr:hypothetical protein [Verrucomicrobiales bacterium]HRI14067.1 hypothetical protein [Verrucomicrobiota bacterium]
MHPLEESKPVTPFSDLAAVRREVDLLNQVIRLLLVGLIIATAGLCLFMYRQTQLLRYQILAQRAALVRATQQDGSVLDALPHFQRLGWRFPDYASNVLARFNLPALPPTNLPAPPKK